jgi:hypothetical protein
MIFLKLSVASKNAFLFSAAFELSRMVEEGQQKPKSENFVKIKFKVFNLIV